MSRTIPAHLRRKRIWNVADFAEFSGLSHKAARARLKRYDKALGGALLSPSLGTNREYTFQPAFLARVIREAIGDTRLEEAIGLFEPIDSVDMRVDALEDRLDDMHQAQRITAMQTGQNTRDIARLRRARAA
jgi:hypothetical protein